jgi:hypothetical protein
MFFLFCAARPSKPIPSNTIADGSGVVARISVLESNCILMAPASKHWTEEGRAQPSGVTIGTSIGVSVVRVSNPKSNAGDTSQQFPPLCFVMRCISRIRIVVMQHVVRGSAIGKRNCSDTLNGHLNDWCGTR